ncbi:16S rRNA (guanine(966)-N(2))-methyltransferase RsmD [Arabiibacter massiliensis]|uniref:16S rRNA (guanine(966)-N(2))-methyltransferase RsmD n=1 Tax=Arabiibacter massiliensis TaxID=1870985 RepID=UPI0009BAF87C|nr:16S rRNA (guanine(966)-N(2))-methyltransferase RsmD [Arabiibacter massiliensis]
MRIIAGEFRGRPLKAPKGDGTRPTTDRVRESMMSVVASARGGFDGAAVLDAFAGSGALGLEALSRGAASAWFYERAGEALRALGGNVKALGLDPRRARVCRADVLKSPPTRARAPFDLVFLDPPYALSAAEALGVVRALAEDGALADDALVVYEHGAATCAEADDAAAGAGLSLAQRKKYGDTVVDIMKPKEHSLL